MPAKKKRRTHRRLTQAAVPTITLDDTCIIISNCNWAPAPTTLSKLTAAGALAVGMATAAQPAVISFSSASAARHVFESAFGCEDDEWGLDEECDGGLPEGTHWVDQVGMQVFACETE